MKSTLEISPSNKKNSLSVLILISSFFLSQFYFWSSGLPQLSHITAILALIIYCGTNRYITIPKIQLLNIFMTYMLVNNIFWFFANGFTQDYIFSIAYWVFNYTIFILILNLKDKPLFIKLILTSILLSYLLELSIWLLGFGRYRFSTRYNGLFNDPNQMAFWVLSTCSIYLFLSKNTLKNLLIYSLAIFLILITLSRSALLGLPFLTIGLVLKSEGSTQKKVFVSIAFLVLILFAIILLYRHGYFDTIIDRFIIGINEKDQQEDARGFNVFFDYPEHLIFGSGQGGYALYSAGGGEIHSTWLGLLFYYGVFGSSVFFAFLYQNFRKLSFSEKMLFLSPMFYGFTTYSARNTIFWFLIGVFMLSKNELVSINHDIDSNTH